MRILREHVESAACRTCGCRFDRQAGTPCNAQERPWMGSRTRVRHRNAQATLRSDRHAARPDRHEDYGRRLAQGLVGYRACDRCTAPDWTKTGSPSGGGTRDFALGTSIDAEDGRFGCRLWKRRNFEKAGEGQIRTTLPCLPSYRMPTRGRHPQRDERQMTVLLASRSFFTVRFPHARACNFERAGRPAHARPLFDWRRPTRKFQAPPR